MLLPKVILIIAIVFAASLTIGAYSYEARNQKKATSLESNHSSANNSSSNSNGNNDHAKDNSSKGSSSSTDKSNSNAGNTEPKNLDNGQGHEDMNILLWG
jgi:cytoskeletal protein RodZ